MRISECPLIVWENRFDKSVGNSALRKYSRPNGKHKISNSDGGKFKVNYSKENDYEAWCVLYDDFVDKIGLDKEFVNYLQQIKLLIELKDKFIQSQVIRDGLEYHDRSIKNQIRRVESAIKSYENQAVKQQTITDVLIQLWKGEKLHIKKQDLTVLEYFKLIKSYNNQQKAA